MLLTLFEIMVLYNFNKAISINKLGGVRIIYTSWWLACWLRALSKIHQIVLSIFRTRKHYINSLVQSNPLFPAWPFLTISYHISQR